MLSATNQTPSVEIDLRVKHHFSNDLYAKEMHLPKDHYAISHKHTYDHLGLLCSGRAVVEVNGIEKVYESGSCINIVAGTEHKITALEDVTWFCIHATSETDISKIDEVLIGHD